MGILRKKILLRLFIFIAIAIVAFLIVMKEFADGVNADVLKNEQTKEIRITDSTVMRFEDVK